MALSNSSGNTIYLSVFGGKITRKVKDANTPGAVERTNKKGNIVHEVLYDNLSGTLTGLSSGKEITARKFILS